ncbi:MAG: hypothetical protein RLZZ352_2302 [Pseudomonadota bacterium]
MQLKPQDVRFRPFLRDPDDDMVLECAVASGSRHLMLAARDDISVNQFIASAAGEKLASILTADDLRQEAAQGRRQDFDRFLQAVPDVPDAADHP